MTREERHLWYDFLSGYPIRFYRQKVLGKFIADFYCAKAKLVLELDGSQHYQGNGLEYDRERTICDCFKFRSRIDSETFNKALNAYANDEKKNLGRLSEYAKKLRVYNKVMELMGVLLNG